MRYPNANSPDTCASGARPPDSRAESVGLSTSAVEPASRREFFKRAGGGITSFLMLAAVGGTVSRSVAAGSSAKSKQLGADDSYDPHQHRYVYLVDIEKCIGCGSCVRACERENDVPEHHFRTWVERYEVSRTGEVQVDSPNGARDGFTAKMTGSESTKSFFVPKICNHCTETPCVQLCPVGASYRTPDGLIMVDEERCIGCGYCVQACPYGSRFIHPVTHVASKCTLCYHRITKGLKPACVHVCPTGARMFGDAMAPDDEVARTVATKTVRVLKPELKTEPNCYYLGLGMEVQ